MNEIRKTIADERKRVQALLRKYELSIRRQFNKFVKEMTSESVIKEVRKLLEAGRIEEAIRIVNPPVISLANLLPNIFHQAGLAESSSLGSILTRLAPTILISFDPTHRRAQQLAANIRSEFLRDFTSQQQQAIRYALSSAFESGASPKEAAQAFRNAIGLSRLQLETIDNYKNLLETNTREALSRELRDRRFDRTLERSSNSEVSLTTSQINRMVERYRDRALIYRSDLVSRMQSQRVLNEAQHESLFQAVELTGLNEERLRRRWNTSIDGRERPSHRKMNGQLRGLREPFKSPSGALLLYPGDNSAPIEERANCRCVLTVSIRDV